MKYVLDVTVNYATKEERLRRVETDAGLAGVCLSDLLEKYPRATSLVLTVVPKSR